MYPKFGLFKLIYEDQDLLIINKDVNLVYSKKNNFTILNIFLYYYPYVFFLYRYGLIHRLDKCTTGILIFSKEPISQFKLLKLFKKHLIIKNYFAICYGKKKYFGILNAFIYRLKKKFITNLKYGKKIKTYFYIIKNIENFLFYNINLKTGRTHQIRSNFEYLGLPILNDNLYKKKNDLNKFNNLHFFLKKCKQILLHANFICFQNSISKINIRFFISLTNEINFIRNLIVNVFLV